MHEGWGYVAAAYGVAAIALVVWFWMILGKLQRVSSDRVQEPPRG